MTAWLSPGCLSQRNSHQIHKEIAHYSIVCGGQALEMNSVSLTRKAEIKCDGGTAWANFAAVTRIQFTSREQTGWIFKSVQTKQLRVCCGTQYHSLK